MQYYTYFPSVIYRDEHPEWVEIFKTILQKYLDKSDDEYFYQTENIVNEKDFNFFFNYLLTSSRNILKEQGYSVEKYQFGVSSMWGQKIKGSNGTNIHVHKDCQLCGWFFLETPENGSYPVYHDPRMNKEMIELDYDLNEVTVATPSIHFNNVLPGTILISNSWLKHQLTPNFSENPTKTLHFTISHKTWN